MIGGEVMSEKDGVLVSDRVMLLDRQMQSDILHKLLSVFPDTYNFNTDDNFNQNPKKLLANLYYLQQHELIAKDSVIFAQTLGDYERNHGINRTEITHKGIDFLLDDGGLSAILNILTIKFEAEQFKKLLQIKIQQSQSIPENKKEACIQYIKSLPAESTTHLMTKLIDYGIDEMSAYLNF